MSKLLYICFVLAIIAISGCTDKEPEPVNLTVNLTPIVTPAFPVSEPSTVYVRIYGSKFDQPQPEMKIIKGTTVKWENLDSAEHIVNGDGFRSPPLKKRDIWSYTFNSTGTFEYNCSVHPSMTHGRIIVE